MRHFSVGIIALSLIATSFSSNARADWQIVPQNSHQLYSTYGLFIDDQTMVVAYGAARSYGSVGGSFAVAGNPESVWHPQVVIIASVNAAMRLGEPGRIYTDALDVHVGTAYEFTINPLMRLSTGFTHYSGHVADGAIDRDLLDLNANLGSSMLFARFVYDLGPYARVGATFIPVIHADPPMNFFGANQFVEIFPWGGQDEQTKPSPYIALGLSEGGTQKFGNRFVFHAQIGAYFGNHFSQGFKPTLRPVLGFYTGADPRLKYYEFKDSTQTFFYAGLMFDF